MARRFIWNLAGEIGLTSGLSLKSGDSLTRAQAAHLFSNLLSSKTRDGSRYVSTLGSSKENVIILALDEGQRRRGGRGPHL